MNKKLLIVGGTGFIGKNLVVNASNNDFEIVVLSLNKPLDENTIKGVKYIQFDLSNKKLIDKDLIGDSFDYVINLLGYIDHQNFQDGGREVIENHFGGLLNLLSILDWSKLKKFVQVGTSDEYGSNHAPQFEGMSELPISPYSLSRVAANQLLQMLNRTENFPVVIFRLFLVYGPGQGINRFIPQIINGLISNSGFPTSSGQQLRDLCFVDDISQGILKSLTNSKSNGEIINLASGQPVKVSEVIKLIQSKIGKGKPEFGKLGYRNGENMELYADISKAKNILKWKPLVKLDEGLDKTINYYLSNLD
jgi:nucleoside-diphosphate-sugar epimerase